MQGRVIADDVPPAQHRTDALGYHGGGRRAAHAQLQRAHKGDVQPDVEYRAEQQKVQRRQAVSDGSQQGGLHIIGYRQRDAQQNQRQVGKGPIYRRFRHLQQHQQRTAHTNENHRQHSSRSPGQRQHPGRGAAHALFITCAKQAADRQRQTVIHAESKVHDKAVQGSRSPDFRQGSVPQDMPGQSGIRQIIELLEQVA